MWGPFARPAELLIECDPARLDWHWLGVGHTSGLVDGERIRRFPASFATTHNNRMPHGVGAPTDPMLAMSCCQRPWLPLLLDGWSAAVQRGLLW